MYQTFLFVIYCTFETSQDFLVVFLCTLLKCASIYTQYNCRTFWLYETKHKNKNQKTFKKQKTIMNSVFSVQNGRKEIQ